MAWFYVTVAVVIAIGVLAVLLTPVLTGGRHAQRAHRAGTVHWYPNYDEDLRYEPFNESDIVAISRADLASFGYSPSLEDHIVPRTFRGRIPGDHRLRLWTCVNRDLRPIWICTAPNIPDLLASHVSRVALSETLLAPSLEARKRSDELDVIGPSEISLGAWNEEDTKDQADENEPPEIELPPEAHRLGCAELPREAVLPRPPIVRVEPTPSTDEQSGTVRGTRKRVKKIRRRLKPEPPRPQF